MEDASVLYGYGRANRPFELSDTSMTEGAFFELDSPVAIVNPQALSTVGDGSVMGSEVTPTSAAGGAHDHYDHESIESGGVHSLMKPRPEIILRWKRFSAALFASVALVVGLTLLFYKGITVKTIMEPVGDSTKSEKLLRRYNTYSGVTMGIFEAFLGLGFAHFFPAFIVYVHNLKWWPGDDPTVGTSKPKKVLLMLFFPVMMIAVGNSFSAVQAGVSTLRLDVVMNSTSLGRDSSDFTPPVLAPDQIYVLNHEETILKTAVERKLTPFQYVESRCQRDVKDVDDDYLPALTRMSDIDSTAAVFGVPIKEWSREIYPDPLAKFSNASLDLDTSFELMFQGQALLERSVGRLPTERCRYSAISGNTTCVTRKKQTTLDELYGYFNGTKTKTADALNKEIFNGVQNAFYGDLDDAIPPTIQYVSFNISSQIQAQYMTFAVFLKPEIEYGLPKDTEVSPKGCKGGMECEYRYKLLDSDAFCGGRSCILPDWQSDMIPKKQASMMQYKKNCQAKNATFDKNLQSFLPGGCEDVTNSVFFSGFGSRLFLQSFGMMKSDTGEVDLPYAKNPRRAVAFTWGRLVWTYTNLAAPFEAKCLAEKGEDACFGLKHTLQPSGRFVLMGKKHLPTKLATSDFRQPISLFQLTVPTIMSPRATKGLAVLEYVDRNSFYSVTADTVYTVALAAKKCSVLADAYISHIQSNVFYLYGAYQPMYMSALLYMFQNAAVTKIRTTSDSDAAASPIKSTRLAGDRTVSQVSIQNTEVGVYTVWIGCTLLVVLAFVTLVFPNERARLAPMMGKNARAERFVAVQTEELYPNLVYMKRFRIGKTGEALKLSEFAVESVSLHHKMEDDEQVFL